MFGLIPLVTGCDNVQNQKQVASTPVHDDHDHDDHDHDDHDHDDHDHDDHDHDDHDDHDHDEHGHDHDLPATVEAAIAQLKK